MIWLVVGFLLFIVLAYIGKTLEEKTVLKEKQDMIDKTLLEHRIAKTNLFDLPSGNTIVNDVTKNNILLIDNKYTRCIDYDEIMGITLNVGNELIKTYTMSKNKTDKKAYYERNKPNSEPVETIYLELEVNTVSFIDNISITIGDFSRSIEKGSAQYIKTFDMADNVYKLIESIVIQNNKKRLAKKRHKSYGHK